MVIFTTAALAIGWALASRSQSGAEAKVEAAVIDSSRAQSEESKALQCADFADDKTRDEFISYGGPAKGCDMGFASPDHSGIGLAAAMGAATLAIAPRRSPQPPRKR